MNIDPQSVSYSSILLQLQTYIESKPEYARWQDFYDSSAGTLLTELVAGLGTFISFKTIAGRRENYLQYALMRSSTIAMAETLGYSVSRGNNVHLNLTVTPDQVQIVNKYDIVGSVLDVDIVSMEDVILNTGVEKTFEITLGAVKSETLTVTNSDIKIHRFTSEDVSDDIQILLNGTEVPISNAILDLNNDKYVTLSNALGAVDLLYLNTGAYLYDTSDILTLNYVELKDIEYTPTDLIFDYGTVDSYTVASTYSAVELLPSIQVNAPLYQETKYVVRARDDYRKNMLLLDTDLVDTNTADGSTPAQVKVTYVKEDLSVLSSIAKTALMTQLNAIRAMGVTPLEDIVDPSQVTFEFDVTIKLSDLTTLDETVNTDVDTILNSYEKDLEHLIDVDQFEDEMNSNSYVKTARFVIHTDTWLADIVQVRGDHVIPGTPNNYRYEATKIGSVYASCDLVSASGSEIVNDEGFTLLDTEGVAVVFKFSVDSGSVTGEDVIISINSGDTNNQVATTINTQVDGHAYFISSVITNTVSISQIYPGIEGNQLSYETVSNSNFVLEDFTGGVDDDVASTCVITNVATVSIVQGEDFTLTNAVGTGIVCKFDIDDAGVTGADIEIDIATGDTANQVAAKVRTAIAAHTDFSASVNSSLVTITQATAGTVGDQTNSENIIDSGFELTDFTGGINKGTTESPEPTWPTTAGDKVSDGGVVWTCIDPNTIIAQLAWNEYYIFNFNLTLA